MPETAHQAPPQHEAGGTVAARNMTKDARTDRAALGAAAKWSKPGARARASTAARAAAARRYAKAADEAGITSPRERALMAKHLAAAEATRARMARKHDARPRREKIVEVVAAHPNGIPARHVAAALALDTDTTSKDLRQLAREGRVARLKVGLYAPLAGEATG